MLKAFPKFLWTCVLFILAGANLELIFDSTIKKITFFYFFFRLYNRTYDPQNLGLQTYYLFVIIS